MFSYLVELGLCNFITHSFEGISLRHATWRMQNYKQLYLQA